MIPVLIVPTYNRGDLLGRLLHSIDHPVGMLVVVDNGRWWPRGRRLPALPLPPSVERVQLVELPGNLGVAGAWNLGIKATADAPWWLVAHDDVHFGVGALGAIAEASGPDRLTLTACGYGCFSLGEEVVRRVGLFDERFYPAYYEDEDYDRRARLAGFTPGRVAASVAHSGGSSVKEMLCLNNRAPEENKALFEHKAAAAGCEPDWVLDRRRRLDWANPVPPEEG